MALFRDGSFRIFWIGQTVSWFGCVMQSVAQGWLVWSLTHSAGQLALTAIMVSLPLLLFTLPAGVLADRVDRRSLLIATQGASLIPALLLGVLTANAAITAPLVLVLAFLQGTVNAFDVTVRQAFLSEVAPCGALHQAVALNAVSFNATRMFAPALAGCTIAAFGAAPCFFINAFSFLLAIGALLLVRPAATSRQVGNLSHGADAPPSQPPPSGGRSNGSHPPALTAIKQSDPLPRTGSTGGHALPLAELREGFSFVLNHDEIGRLLLMVALMSLLGIPFVPLLPAFADALQVGARGLGAMSACAGAGSLLAAAALALAGEIRVQKKAATPAAMLFAAALLLFSLSGGYYLSLFALFLAGGSIVTFLTLVSGALQQSCPDRLRGRVMAAYSVALLGMAPLGNALLGVLAATLGAAPALSLSSSLCLAAMMLLRNLAPAALSHPPHPNSPSAFARASADRL